MNTKKQEIAMVTTVWKNGTWKQWTVADAEFARNDPDWLCEIPAIVWQCFVDKIGRIRKSKLPSARGYYLVSTGYECDWLLFDGERFHPRQMNPQVLVPTHYSVVHAPKEAPDALA